MSWLTNFVRPKVQVSSDRSGETPDNLWLKCNGCGAMSFHRELESNHQICKDCDYHLRLSAVARLNLLLDKGYKRLKLPAVVVDPLKFRDRKKYTERLKDAQANSADTDALLVGYGTIHNVNAVVAVFDFDFMAGSMGVAVGEGLLHAAAKAVETGSALIVIPASGGARMQEGILSLMQMPRSTVAVAMVREAKLPYIVVLTDPTTGGVSASFAMLGDITLAEPGATVGFAGARVIEETIREKLPEGFQKAEYLLQHGIVDAVVHRHELKDRLGEMISLLMIPDRVSNRGDRGAIAQNQSSQSSLPGQSHAATP
ncbi:MAG: acetyl-CoA carboxylase, carboxyltransferase subunit beta [Candidatus Pacebacteria bacterium]|nr:acetyl-CoA carboxylase, carboxyltransferase subunit beta [Candidatus Paceibacterota bacterium]